LPFHVGPTELIIVLVIVLIIFGVGRLPEIGGAMGKAIREFRSSQAGTDEPEKEMETGPAPQAPNDGKHP